MSNEIRGKIKDQMFIDDSPFGCQKAHEILKDILSHTSFQTFALMAIMEVQQIPLRLYCDGVYSELEPEHVVGEREAYLMGNPVGWRKILLDLEKEHVNYTSFALFFKEEELEVTATRVNENSFLWGMRTDNPLYRELVAPFQGSAIPPYRNAQ